MKFKKRILFALCISIFAHARFGDQVHKYMLANYHQFRGNTQTAYNWYKELFSSNSSVYTYKGFINFLYNTQNYKQIIHIMETTAKTFENDPDIQTIFGHALRFVGRTKEASQYFITLSQKFKNHLEIAFEAAKAYIDRKELENAQQAINALLNTAPKKPNYFILFFLKAQINMQLGNYDKALKDIQESISMHPHFDKNWLLFAMIQEKQGRLQDAIKGYTNYLEVTNEIDKNIEQHLLELMMQQKASEQNTSILLLNKSCYQKALVLFERKQYKQALAHINNCLEKNPSETNEQLLKIQILHAMHNYQDATNSLVQWLHKKPNDTVLFGILHLLARTGAPIALVINAFEQLHQKNTKTGWPALYLADLYTRADNMQKALTYHQKALTLTANKTLRTKVQFQMGLIYYKQKEYDKMVTVLHNAQKNGIPFPPLLNLLAYYYATKGKKLPDAQKLIDRVLKQDPHNPHFLDTQAMIWYKQKKYEPAQQLLRKLSQQAPDDITILIHLAKTYDKLGNQSEAKSVIQSAQQHAHTTHEQKRLKHVISLLE